MPASRSAGSRAGSPGRRGLLLVVGPEALPADLTPVVEPEPIPAPDIAAPAANTTVPAPTVADSGLADAVEVDRVVPASGNLQVAGQQFWLGPHRAGQPVTLWIDTTTAHLAVAGQHLKTVPSRLSSVDLARLRADGARPAGPPPARPSPGLLAAGGTVELDRLVHAQGVVVLAGRQLPVGMPLAGRRVTLRLDAQLVHVIADGQLWRTIAFTLPPDQRARLRGARIAGPPPVPADTPVRVQRRVSSRGGIQVAGQRVQVGFRHAGATVTIEVEDTMLRVLDEHDEIITVVARTSRKEVSRYKAYGHTKPAPA